MRNTCRRQGKQVSVGGAKGMTDSRGEIHRETLKTRKTKTEWTHHDITAELLNQLLNDFEFLVSSVHV